MGRIESLGQLTEGKLLDCLEEWRQTSLKTIRLVMILKMLVIDHLTVNQVCKGIGKFPQFKELSQASVSTDIQEIVDGLAISETGTQNVARIRSECKGYRNRIKAYYDQIIIEKGWDNPSTLEAIMTVEVINGKPTTRFSVTIPTDISWEQLTQIHEGLCEKAKAMDAQIRVNDVSKGSTIIEFETSPEIFDRIQALFQSGELTEIAGFKVLDVSLLEDMEDDESEESNLSIEVFRYWFEGIYGDGWLSEDQIPQLVGANRAIQLSYGSVVRYKYLRFPTCVLMLGIRIERAFDQFKINIKLFPDFSECQPDLEQFLLPIGLKFSILDGADNLDFTSLVEGVTEDIDVDIEEFVYGGKFSVRLDYDGHTIIEELHG